jgi:hypothetical protein
VLTKDNLVKRCWKRCTKCCFCTEQETIQHLFFYCLMARHMWGCVCFAFGVSKPVDVQHLFGPGLEVFRKSKGILCWSEWQHYAGRCGSAGMIWFFINHNINLFCRWSLGGHSGSGVGLSFLKKMGEPFWRKVVVSWRPSHWTSFISLGGTLLSVLRTSVWVVERLVCLLSYLVCLVNLSVLVQPRCCLDRCVSVCSGSLDAAS